jgi:hypothetical protein
MTAGSRCVCSVAASALTLALALVGRGIPPPEPSPPIGFEEWQRTGELPKKLFLPSTPDNGHLGVIVSTPDQAYRRRDRKADWGVSNLGDPSFPGFSVISSPDNPKRHWLTIGGGDKRPSNKSTYAEVGYSFDVAQNDVIPIYDQIYATKWLGSGLQLTLVTDQVPAEFRPRLDTRTICSVAIDAFLFYKQHSIYKGRTDVDDVRIEFEKLTDKAILKLEPHVLYTGGVPPEGQVPTLPARPPLTVEVSKGGLLTARGRSYKVLNVVPPQDIEGVGHLVGWIEVAADPVVPASNERRSGKGDKSN